MKLAHVLRYPMNEENWLKTMGIGTVLELLTFLVIPQVLLQGYYVRVMRRTVEGDDEPPELDGWNQLLVEGAQATVILGVYKAIPIAAVIIYFIPEFLATVSEGDLVGILWALLSAVVLYGALFALFGYAAAAGLVAFAETGSMAAAFSPRLARVLFSRAYLVAYIKVLLVTAAVVALKFAIALVPGVNVLLVVIVPFLVKYVWVVWARLWADAYADAMGSERRGERRPDAAGAGSGAASGP